MLKKISAIGFGKSVAVFDVQCQFNDRSLAADFSGNCTETILINRADDRSGAAQFEGALNGADDGDDLGCCHRHVSCAKSEKGMSKCEEAIALPISNGAGACEIKITVEKNSGDGRSGLKIGVDFFGGFPHRNQCRFESERAKLIFKESEHLRRNS